MGVERGADSYINAATRSEPILRNGDIDLGPTFNYMRMNQRILARKRGQQAHMESHYPYTFWGDILGIR